jgi:glycosyltransferase involved in cell wall biosynthesis
MIQDNAAAGGVVPMFNAEKTIGATLASIRRQTYQALDIVVLDDGSTDGSASIVTAYAEKDQRIRLLRQPNGGVATARNLGAAATGAEFLSFIDADDLWAPSKIALRMDFHRRTMEGLAKQIYFYMRGHSAALLAQHGRTGIRSNLKQAFKWKPLWYLGRVRRRLCGLSAPEDRLLWQEIAGYLSGTLVPPSNQAQVRRRGA